MHMKRPLLFTCLFSVFLWGSKTVQAQSSAAPLQGAIPSGLREKAAGWLNDRSSGFTENKGQLHDQDGKPNPAVKYLLYMNGLNVQLRAAGFSYDAWAEEEGKGRSYHRVDIELEGADPAARLVPEYPLPGSNTTEISARGTFSNIQEYSKVTYKDIYPGIDLEFTAKSGADKPVEYNFIIHPGADAAQVRMRYRNGSDITLKDGMIEMQLAFGTLKEKIPLSYTQQDGRSLAVQYRSLDEAENLYAFHVPDYDRSQTLVIDPTPSIVWATYYGGISGAASQFYEHPTGLTVDAAGNVLMTGMTTTHTGLATAGAYMTAGDLFSFSSESFCVKYTSGGTRLWSTYIGTNGTPAGTERNSSVRTDASGNVFLLMLTGAQAPTSAGVHDPTWSGTADPYLLKLDPSGSTMMWATYIGAVGNLSNAPTTAPGMHVLPSGDVLVGGAAPDTPTSALLGFGTGYQPTAPGDMDGYIVKIKGSNGTGMWGTYFGGPDIDYVTSIASDASGNIYIGGATTSTSGIATPGAFQAISGGDDDMFIARLSSDGSTLAWATYYGGVGVDGVREMLVNHSNQLVVGGFSSATSGSLATPGAFQQQGVVLLAQFSLAGSRTWATHYLPPIPLTQTAGYLLSALNHIAVDETDHIYISGIANGGSDVATSCSVQPTNNGGDLYVAKFSPNGQQRIWGTYYGRINGGNFGEGYLNVFPNYYISAFAYAGNGEFYAATATQGDNMATPGAAQTTRQGLWEAILVKFNEGEIPADLVLSSQTIAPLSQTACILGVPALITGNVVTYATSAQYSAPVQYQWQVADVASGPWNDLPGEIFKDLQPLSASTDKYYRRIVLLNGQYCDKEAVDTSAVASVLVNANVAPIASADGPQ